MVSEWPLRNFNVEYKDRGGLCKRHQEGVIEGQRKSMSRVKEGCHRRQGEVEKGLVCSRIFWDVLDALQGFLPARLSLSPGVYLTCTVSLSRSSTAFHQASPKLTNLVCRKEKVLQLTHLQNVTEVLADVGHVICSLKQPFLIKLPPSSSP